MKRFINMGSIDQMRTIVKNVKFMAQYVGQTIDNQAIYDNYAKMPVITAVISEKIHGCFEKNTLITLANGEMIPISKIEEGVYILSYNELHKKQEVKKVLKTVNQKLDKDWLRLIFDKTEIICTKDHKIYTSNRGYIEAQNLSMDDIFLTL